MIIRQMISFIVLFAAIVLPTTSGITSRVHSKTVSTGHLETNSAMYNTKMKVMREKPPTSKQVDQMTQQANPVVKENMSPDEEAELMIDHTDPCNTHTNCGQCSEDSRCGWCAANNQCMIGGTERPKLSVCASWTKGFCEVSKCGDYSHCMSCLADPYCGWCSAAGDDPLAPTPGKCMEGGSSGPGEAEGECPDQWRHSPVRKGTAYAMASHLASTHGPYLREVCESVDGRIPYAPAPPAKPAPKPKDPVILTMYPRNGPLFGGTHVTITGLWFGYTKTDQQILIGGRPCEETIWKSQSVMICVTSRAYREEPGTFDVVAIYDGRRSDNQQSPDQKDMAKFDYREIEIDAIHPAVGKTEGGTIVSIVGKNFGYKNPNPTITLAGVPCVVVQWESPELIKCATPPGYGTHHELKLVIDGIEPATPAVYFDYAAPIVSSLSPRFSPSVGNKTMIVTGSNFGTRHAMAVVTVNTIPCISQEWVSHSRIDCVTPPGVGKGHVVRVKVDQRTSTNDEWMLDYLAPVVANLSPDHGPTPGSYAILISGSDFSTGAYEPSLQYEAMEWQYDVLDVGAPVPFGPTDQEEVIEKKKNGNATNITNSTDIIIGDKIDSASLVSAVLPSIAINNNDIRNDIQNAAIQATIGHNGAKATEAVANATLSAALGLNDTTGVGVKVAAVAAAAVEAIKGVTEGRQDGEEPTEAADKVMRKLKVQVEKQGGNTNISRLFLEIEEINSTLSGNINNSISGNISTADAMNDIRLARQASVQAELDLQKEMSPCAPNEAIDYTPRGKKCVRALLNGISCLELTIVSSQILRCIVPEGIGKNLSVAVIVGNQTSMSVTGEERINRLNVPEVRNTGMKIVPTEQWRYDAPIVTFMYPDIGATAGGFVMTLKGRNFGTRDWGEGTVLVTIAGQPCTETTWLSDNVIECIVPKGVGARHPVEVTVGGQVYPPRDSAEMLLFSYNPPIVLDVEPKNGPTDGGYPVIITGRNFGRMMHHPQPYIGGVACTQTTWISDSVIKCIAPQGHGKDKNVVVWVGEQHSDVENNYFQYDVPIVDSVEPNHCRTIGGCKLTITGHNFGHEQGAHIGVYVDGHLCAGIGRGDQPQWLSHHKMECVVSHGIGEKLDVSVEVSEQISPVNELFHFNYGQVFGLRPNHGKYKGGEEVTVIGENFGTQEAMELKVQRKIQLAENRLKNLRITLKDLQKQIDDTSDNDSKSKLVAKRDVYNKQIEEAKIIFENSKKATPSDLIKVSMGDYEVKSVEWISDTEIRVITGEGTGGDLIPRLSIDGQLNTDSSIYDEKSKIDLLQKSKDAMKESLKRDKEGDTKFGLIYRKKSKQMKSEAEAMIVRSRGSMFLYDPPEVHAMSVNHGPTMGDTMLELTGKNFAPDSRVVFGSMSASNKERAPRGPNPTDPMWDISPCKETTFVSSSMLTCLTPVGMGKNHEIFIETGGRRYAQRNVSAINDIPKCPAPPPAPTNGILLASFEYLQSVVTYACEENHTMIGESTLSCESPGLWVPDVAPTCRPPPKPIATILYPDNETNATDVNEDIEPEEVKVMSEMQRLMVEQKEKTKELDAVKDKESEAREIAEEHYKADQNMVKKQKMETDRVLKMQQEAKDAVQRKMDESALKEAEEEQKRKDADAAAIANIKEEREKQEEAIRAKQDAAAAKRFAGGNGGGAAAGTPGTGMLRNEPSAEEQKLAMEKAEKEESIEKIMANIAGLVQKISLTKTAMIAAEEKVKKTSSALDAIEKELSAASGDKATEKTLAAKRDVLIKEAEDAKREMTAAKLENEKITDDLQKSIDDPAVKEARISEVQMKFEKANQLKSEVEMSSKRAEDMLLSMQKEIDESKSKDGANGPSTTTLGLEKELKQMKLNFEQSKVDLKRVTKEANNAGELLAQTKDKVETGTVDDLIKEVEEESTSSETKGVGESMSEIDQSRMITSIERNTKMDDDTKKTAIEAIKNSEDVAQASIIANAASNGAEAIREAAATPVPSMTIFTQSDVVGDYVMNHPGYPGRKNWEIFAVRVVGGAGLMQASSAHLACQSFSGASLVTRDIAHAGRMSGFQRCQPGWIERYGADVPDPDNNGQCISPPDEETGKCQAGTEESKKGSSIECLHECPKASAVIMAGDSGCPTDQSPPCDTSDGQMELNGSCMTAPGTVVSSKTVLAQALCTRPKNSEEKTETAFLEVEIGEQIPALLVYNISTGMEENRYYDLTSEKGRSLDPKTNFLLSGGMMIRPSWKYDTPIVYSVKPSNGPAAGGSTHTIKGLNFGPNDAYTGEKLQIAINEIDGKDGKEWVDCRTTTWVSDNEATCVTPAGVGTFRTMRGSLATLIGEQSKKLFTYDKPVLTKLEPSTGAPRGGYSVIVHGYNFGTVRSTWVQGQSIIKIDGRDCLSTNWISDTKVRCRVPPGWSKDRSIALEGVAGQNADSKILFSYLRPVVNSITPDVVPTQMDEPIIATISGNNFGQCGGKENSTEAPKYCPDPKAFINGYPCISTKYVSHNQIKCTVPNGVGTKLRVTVKLGNLDSATNSLFTYEKPILKNVEPKHGEAIGTNIVTITGEHFGHKSSAGKCTAISKSSCLTGTCCISSPPPSLEFNDIVCATTTWISNTELKCKVNPKPGVGARNPISVIIGQQKTKTLNEEVRYTINPPTTAKILPSVVPRGGGTYALKNKGREGNVWENVAETIMIYGNNYGTSASTVKAGFDDMTCSTAIWVSNNQIRCVLSLPFRDGFEDRTPWVVVGDQESFAHSRPVTEVEYRVMIYKEYPRFGLSDESKHLFITLGLTLQQCKDKCDETVECKAISRPNGIASSTSGKCEGWNQNSLSSCAKNKLIQLHIHETVPTTKIGACHSEDTMRLGPEVSSISQTDGLNPDGGDKVLMTGFNFGMPGSPKAQTAAAFIDEIPCTETIVKSDTELECTTPPNENSGGSMLLKDNFDTYMLGIAGYKAALNPMYFDASGSSGSISKICGSTSMPGGAWVMPSKGSKSMMLNPLNLRFGGIIKFAIKVGNDQCKRLTSSLKDMNIEIQYTTDTKSLESWNTLRSFLLSSTSPYISNNEWHQLSADIPSITQNGGAVSLRFVQSGESPNIAVTWAIDDIRVLNNGGPVAARVMVDGTKSVMAPPGKDSKGRIAPNAVSTSYVKENMVNSAVAIQKITTDNVDGIGGWTGFGTRHMQCSRNFKSHGRTSIEQCVQKCVDAFPKCTMFSWGSTERLTKETTQPIDCRISLTKDGCSPEQTTGTKGNQVRDPLPNVVTLYSMGGKEEISHGAFTDRVSSHAFQPLAGGVFVGTNGYLERYQKVSKSDVQLQLSSDITMIIGTKIKITFNTPILVKKVSARQSPALTGPDGLGCLAKTMQFTWEDGTVLKLEFPEIDTEKDMEVLPDAGGNTGGEYATLLLKGNYRGAWPLVASYQVEVLDTHGKCPSKIVKLRSIEVKGEILTDLALLGGGFSKCDVSDNDELGVFKKMNDQYGCLNAFDGGSLSTKIPRDVDHAWVTDGLGAGASVTTTFTKAKRVYGVAVKQNQYHRVNKLKITFIGGEGKDSNKEVLKTFGKNSGKDYEFIQLPGIEGIMASSIKFEILSTQDKYAIPDGGWRLFDDFKTNEFDSKKWLWPAAALRGVSSVRYGYDSGRVGTAPLYFEGVASDKTPVRSLTRFPISHSEITVELERTHKCSNHFIILSPNVNYKFSTGPEDDTVKFMYNCETKYLYGPKEKNILDEKDENMNKLQYKENNLEVQCPYQQGQGMETWNILVEEEKVTFGGSKCGAPLVMQLSNRKSWNKDGQFFVYIGAHQDMPNEKSYFGRVEVKSWGTGLRDLAYLGKAEEE